MSHFIGIDIGASFIKGAVFDIEKLRVKNVIKYDTPTISPSLKNKQSTRFEINGDLYEKVVRKIISELSGFEKEIDGIVFSTQMHGMILVDRHLKQIAPFIGWQDERLLEKANRSQTWLDLLGKKLESLDTTKTGITFRTGLMGSTLFWLKEKGILKKHKGAKALFLGDYIAAKLTNGERVTHRTNACGSGLFDVEKNTWDENILRALSIDKSYLPEVVSTGTKVGDFLHAKKNIPVFVSVGDMQAAVLGSLIGLGKKREVCINIGTGSQVSTIVLKFKQGNYDVRSYFDNTYLNTVTFIPAGRALQVIVAFIEDIGQKIFNVKKNIIWEKLTEIVAEKKTLSTLKADISFFKNSISQEESGSFSDITEKNFTIENMFLSALVAMAQNYWTAYKRLNKGKITDRIICAGGLARKITPLHLLLQKQFKRKISFAPYEEETLVGLFILSLFNSGKFSTIKEGSDFVKKNRIKFT